MPLYIDVSVTRIQQYLGRWHALRGQRGASALLVAATDPNHIPLPEGCGINDETGRADSVVHLVVDNAGGDASVTADEVVTEVFRHLRDKLPAAELAAGWAEGDSYTAAYPAIRAAVDTGGAAARASLPPGTEFPPVDRCKLCRDGVSVDEVSYRDDGGTVTARACADCCARNQAADRVRRQRTGAGPVEARLLEALGLDPVEGRVSTVEELAGLGPGIRGMTNHLATVKIDGNAVGAFFGRLAASGAPDTRAMSRALGEAAEKALGMAAGHVHRAGEKAPAIPHIAGGDDLVVSLPAARAWPFTLAYLRCFEDEIQARAESALGAEAWERLAETCPTASAGIAFARTRHPFVTTSALAEEALRLAKRSHPALSAVVWADLTQDGDTVPDRRTAFTLAELESDTGDVIGALCRLDPARVHALDRAADADHPVTARGALHRAVRRLQVEEPARTALLQGDVERSRDLLQMTRWWPRGHNGTMGEVT